MDALTKTRRPHRLLRNCVFRRNSQAALEGPNERSCAFPVSGTR
jgi:hypothetical protein